MSLKLSELDMGQPGYFMYPPPRTLGLVVAERLGLGGVSRLADKAERESPRAQSAFCGPIPETRYDRRETPRSAGDH
jgi:hypothetical protein